MFHFTIALHRIFASLQKQRNKGLRIQPGSGLVEHRTSSTSLAFARELHDIAAPDAAAPAMKPPAETRLKQSPFWRFSLRLYANAEVRSACLALQDKCGVDVNILLFLLWAASEKSVLGVGKIKAIDRLVKPWRTQAVVPLRALRRALKTPSRAIAPHDAEDLRSRIKAAELAAENLQQDAMYRFAQMQPPARLAPSAIEAARRNLAAYQSILGPFPAAEIDKIQTAFDRLEERK